MARYSLKSKVCLVGESAVGKTSLVKKYVLDVFDETYLTTIGTKVSKKVVQFDSEGVQVSMSMMIWDIMGQSSFRSVLQDSYFFGANGIIAVCDMTRKETLQALDEWAQAVRDVAGGIPIIIFANKSDLRERHQTSEKDVELKARKHSAPFYLTSAKTGENVNAGFQAIASAIVKRQSKGDR
ncbi:MAG: GTP-binding protein [Euryarchaeota archaeon]|nr:GTP-binding protein [Euryarchaeota archaeon]